MSATFRDITRQAAARRGRASAMRVGASRRSGFALPAAIFLMVILAALGAYIVSINTLQTSSSSLDVLGTRAYQAARAGTEWGAFQVLRGSAVPPAGCFSSTTLTFAGTSLAPFTTTVTCSRSAATDELGTPVTVDRITADACNEPASGVCPNASPTASNYAARQIQITIGQP